MLHYLPEEWRYAIRDALLAELDVEAPEFQCPALLAPAPPDPPELSPHERALRWLLSLWESHVEEPPGRGYDKIDDLIRGARGLGWSTADARNWTPRAPYIKNGMFAWCGATAARALGDAGLRPEIRSKNLASTVRLFSFCKGTKRNLDLSEIKPGDVLVVSAGVKRQGEHIVIAERVDLDSGLVYTVEGNAKGLGPDGRIFEGVVKRTRPLPKSAGGPGRDRRAKCPISGLSQRSEVIHAYRFLEADFVAPEPA